MSRIRNPDTDQNTDNAYDLEIWMYVGEYEITTFDIVTFILTYIIK